MGKYFGTDGFRGEAGVTLTAEHAFKIGRCLGYRLREEITEKEQKRIRVAIGKDTRLSSYMLEYAIASGFASSGVDVYLLHVITTPGVSYVIKREGFDMGIMITASHNPFSDNGIKLIGSDGSKISDELTDFVEEHLDSENFDIPFASGADIGRIHDHYSGRNGYIGYLISLASSSYKGLRVGIDSANGAAFSIARSVFAALGAEVYTINDKPDGLNVNYKCGSTHPEALAEAVRENRLDVGFAFDGDADRCIAIDENGTVTDGDSILYILARNMKQNGMLKNGSIVATVMSNGGLARSLKNDGIDVEVTRVGDRYVYRRMQEIGASLGGEQSGHIIISDLGATGDGILTAISLAERMLDSRATLSELCRGLVKFPQTSGSIRVRDREKAISDTELISLTERLRAEQNGEGRILVRLSGTEPVIRIMAEAKTISESQAAVNAILSLLKSKGYADEK